METLDKKLQNLPSIKAGEGMYQSKFHEYDVYNHTMKYVDYLKEITSSPELIVAGYLHDVGKPIVAKPKVVDGVVQFREDGVMYHDFHDHEKVGEQAVREMDSSLFDTLGVDQSRVADLVGCHYIPMTGMKAMKRSSSFDEFVAHYHMLENVLDEAPVSREECLTMFIADTYSKGKSCNDNEYLFAVKDALLGSGKDLHALYQRAIRTEKAA